jgi:AraC-like DNA-binding protein
MDALASRLASGGVSGTVLAHVLAADAWAIRVNPRRDAVFHGVTAGTCWLRLDDESPQQLFAGDVVLLPGGDEHVLASAPHGRATPLDWLAKQRLIDAEGQLRLSDGDPTTQVLCATYAEEGAALHPLLQLLPPIVVVRAHDAHSPLATLMQMMRTEQRSAGLASAAVVDRLVDVLLVYVIREWLQDADAVSPSWLTALRDPVVAEVLARLHADPAAPWNVERLAAAGGVSRATLGRRFVEFVGESPSAYLTRWRLHLAARRLRTTDDSVGKIARSVGYTSEYAFSRAFSRAWGAAPGRFRRDEPTEPAEPASSGRPVIGR